MKSINLKNTGLTILGIALVAWLLLVWAPMIRKDFETFDKSDEVLRHSKATTEKVKSEIERIEKTTPRQIPQGPDGHGSVL